MKVSVCLGSSRPGGLDIAFRGLAEQTHEDFEVVFTDGRYAKRHAEVLDAWERHGPGTRVPMFHIPNHRESGGPWPNQMAGFNTAFALADGDVVLMMMDYAFARPDWVASHARAHEGRRVVVIGEKDVRRPLPMRMRDGAEPSDYDPATVDEAWMVARYGSFDEVSTFARPFRPEDLFARPWPECPATEPTWMNVRTKNESFPTEAIRRVGGCSEVYDFYQGPGDMDLGWRLTLDGLGVEVIREKMLVCSDPRDVLPNGSKLMRSAHRRAGPPWDYKPCWDEGCALFEGSRGRRSVDADSPRDLNSVRERIGHWRERSQERAPVLAPDIIDDAAYFGRR